MKEVIVQLRDDYDGKLASNVVPIDTYGFTWIDGCNYEIDLRSKNVDLMNKTMAPFIEVSRRVSQRKKNKKSLTASTRKSNPDENKQVRKWAAANGIHVGQTRIREEVKTQFRNALDKGEWVVE